MARVILERVLPGISNCTEALRLYYLAGLLVSVFVTILSWMFMSYIPLSGDEGTYAETSKLIALFLRGGGISLEDFQAGVVDNGWFMPGMPLILSPLYILVSNPDLTMIRAYVSIFTFMLWLWALREIHLNLGSTYSVVFIFFPVFVSTWQIFSTTIWGDLSGGLLAVIVLARSCQLINQMFTSHQILITKVLSLEFIMVGMVYMRGSLILVVIAIHILLITLALTLRNWRDRINCLKLLFAGLTVFFVTLLPWSITATHVLGSPVLTTSSLPLSFGVTFGNHDQLCFGKCRSGNIWHSASDFSRRYASEHGVSEIQIQKMMATYAVRDLNIESYVNTVRGNFKNFVTRPYLFTKRFIRLSKKKYSQSVKNSIYSFFKYSTMLFYIPFFALLVAMNLFIIRKPWNLGVVSLCIKTVTICLFVQPFLHPSHARYWVTYAPLMAIAGGAFLSLMSPRVTGYLCSCTSYDSVREPPMEAPPILLKLQVAYVTLLLIIACFICLA
jgi:hypothetical protein